MKIIVKEIPHSRIVTVGAYIRAGSFQEEGVYGVAHFVEHMLFNGTKNRTAQRILYAIEGIGGELDASTTYDYTEFMITVPLKYWITAVDVLTDMLFNYALEERSFNREKKIILDELGESLDEPGEFLSDLIQQKMFKDYPARQLIAGTPDQVKAITIADLHAFLKRHYRSDNMCLAVTGNILEQEVLQEVARRVSVHKSLPTATAPFKFPELNSRFYSFKKDVEQFYWGIGMFAPSAHLSQAKERWAMEILTTLLGGNASSRLFQTIREERGLAYTVDLNYETLADVGLLSGVFSSGERNNTRLIRETVLSQLEEVKQNISEDEIERAKAYLEGILTIRSESQLFLNNFTGENFIYNNRCLSLDEYIQGIHAVSKEDLFATARKYFRPANMLFVELAPK